MQAVGSGDADAALEFVNDRPVLAQDLQMEVDRAVPDAAAAQIRDEGLPQPVQERAAEQDGMRELPAWASMSAMWAVSTRDGSSRRTPSVWS